MNFLDLFALKLREKRIQQKITQRGLAEKLNIDCDVLKVGHHGSNSSSTAAFLKAASPKYAAISVGKDNMYSHPSNKTIVALKNCGAEVYRTDKNGDISFYVENGNIRVETEK